jgi:leucyl aminopeptidase (aminopeptidase T)
MYEAVRGASRIEVTTGLGTHLVATFDPLRKWIPSDGRYLQPGQWGNLPEGETFTAPANLEGVLFGEAMGDYFAPRYGLFARPVRLRIENGRLVDIEAPGSPELQADIEGYVTQHPNSRRVGELGIGTNVGLTKILGNILQDEKFPGVHVAFGDPFAHRTGADWECPTHVDVLASKADVFADGHQVMAVGRLLV